MVDGLDLAHRLQIEKVCIKPTMKSNSNRWRKKSVSLGDMDDQIYEIIHMFLRN